MANFDIARPVVANQGFGASLLNIFSNLATRLIGWNEGRVTRNALSKLTDRELDDLGLSRGDIENMFR